MKVLNINPNAILTTKDFPVYNPHILKIYFKICKNGNKNILPATPVIAFSTGLPLLSKKTKKAKAYNKRIKEYLKEHRKVKYLMLDGSHKTTALCLTHNKINCVVFEKDSDIEEFRDLVKTGEVFSLMTRERIRGSLDEMAEHLEDAKFFESVEDKTLRMVEKKVIEDFMISEWMKR